jgi:hypothetical protein
VKALATIASGRHAELLRLSGPTFRAYADRHGYELVIGAGEMPEPRAGAWAKVPLIRRLLDTYELVLWVDVDAMILDGSVDVAELLDVDAFQGLVLNGTSGPNTALLLFPWVR